MRLSSFEGPRVAIFVAVLALLFGGVAAEASAATLGFEDQAAGTVLQEQFASTGVHIGPSPFAGQSGALTVVARPSQARSGANVAALAYDAQTDFSSSWIRFDKPQSRVSFYACRTGGGGDPPTPNVNVDAFDASGNQLDNQQGIPCTLNGPLVPVTVEKAGISFIHVAGTGGSAAPGDGWAIDDLEYAVDPPAVPPAPPAPPKEAPPTVQSVQSAAPVAAGSAALLNAAVSGTAARLDWDVTGDGRTDVSCPGSQTTLRFRVPVAQAGGARASASPTFTVRAVDAAGAATSFAQTFAVASPTAAATAPLRRVQKAFARTPVYACGAAQDFASAGRELLAKSDASSLAQILRELGCENRTIVSGTLTVTGCFKPILSAQQIPAAELGSLQPMLDIAKLPTYADVKAGKDAPAGIFVERALNFTDAWISNEPVLVNGVKLTPERAGRIVYFPQVRRLFSADASLSVGGIRLDAPSKFSLNTVATNAGRVPLGTFRRLPGGTTSLAGFSLAGDVSVVLTPGAGGAAGGAELRTRLELPAYLGLLGADAQNPITIHATSAGALALGNLQIGPLDANVGPIGLKGLQINYTEATGEWRGMGDLCFEENACVNAREVPGEAPPGGIVIRDGKLQRLYASVTLPGAGITLFPGVQLNRIGAGIGLDPTRLLGGARVTAAGIFEIDGALGLAFPSSATPYVLRREEVGQSFPAPFYDRRYTTATMALGADAFVRIPFINARVRLGGGYLLYSAPAYVAFGGGIDFDFVGIVSITGHADGEFNFANAKFNLSVGAQVCVVDIICAGADAIVSDQGAGACVRIGTFLGDINVGGGVVFNPYRVVIWPFDGCRWTRFADRNVFSARAAQSDAPLRYTIKAGDPSLAIKLDGTAGAPKVRVTAPDGSTYESSDGAGAKVTKAVRILRSEQLKSTVVGLEDPKPGTYTIEKLPGSPDITATSRAEDPPPAQVSAEVSAPEPVAASALRATASAVAAAQAAGRRTLTYDIRRRPGQKVTFMEVGLGGRRTIGATSGGRGKLVFTPAPGRDRRRIEAHFTLSGLGGETKTIATFTPPSDRLPAPSAVRIRRTGTALQISWPRVPGATAYDVVATSAAGGQRHRRTAAASVTLGGFSRGSGGTVAVRPRATLRQGAIRRASFRAAGPRAATRFGRLPKLRRAAAR